MPQSVTVHGPPEPRLTLADVPPGAMFLSADGDVCLRSQPGGHLVTNLSKTRTWFSRERYEYALRHPESTYFDGTEPIRRLIRPGERVEIVA